MLSSNTTSNISSPLQIIDKIEEHAGVKALAASNFAELLHGLGISKGQKEKEESAREKVMNSGLRSTHVSE